MGKLRHSGAAQPRGDRCPWWDGILQLQAVEGGGGAFGVPGRAGCEVWVLLCCLMGSGITLVPRGLVVAGGCPAPQGIGNLLKRGCFFFFFSFLS